MKKTDILICYDLRLVLKKEENCYGFNSLKNGFVASKGI